MVRKTLTLSTEGNKEPLWNGKYNSILTKLLLKPMIVAVIYVVNNTILIIAFYQITL